MKAYYCCFLFEEQNPIFFSKTLKFCKKKCIFWHQMFSKLEPKVNYFKKFLSNFNKQGLKWKLINTASYFDEKNGIFFSKFLNFPNKFIFWPSIFLEFFCFLPIYMLNFNKWGLKWKLVITTSYFEDKNPILFQKIWNFCKKMYFLT